MAAVRHLTWDELEAGLDAIRQSPRDQGAVELIVCRPRVGEREVLEVGELDLTEGLVGDNWRTRGGWNPKDPAADLDMQLNLMNSRAVALVAHEKDRWALAGDQLYLDLD